MELKNALILTLVLLISGINGARFELQSTNQDEYSEVSSSDESVELKAEDILFENLRALLRNGDAEFGLNAWAPFEEDIDIEDSDIPFKFMLDGFDTFEKVQTVIHENNTADFELFFPRINFRLEQETDDGLILVQGAQINTTLIGTIEVEPMTKCIRLIGIDVELDYDTIDYDIVKRGFVHPMAEELVFEYAEFFREENKPELIDAYEDMIEDEVEELFVKLECWYFSEEKLLTSIKNSL